jgi:probable F420-dependent oxidoreductase
VRFPPDPRGGGAIGTTEASSLRGRRPEAVLVLSENWTLTPPRDLRALVRIAQEAEDAGVGTVMLSEHVVLGPSAGTGGRMLNPRDYAAPGNQDPGTPWPDTLVLGSAIAAATGRVRLALAAVIAPLRHPLLLAKELGTLDLLAEGRLVVQPTVSWSVEEYAALGVPFDVRGAILDEQLAAMRAAWRDTPATFAGRFFRFEDAYLEPKAFRSDGPRMWFGGEHVHDALLRRLVAYGHGFHPFGTPTDEDLRRIREAMVASGRGPDDLEMVGGIRGTFPDATGVADLGDALDAIPAILARGFTSVCFKPSMFTDDAADVPTICRTVVERIVIEAGRR